MREIQTGLETLNNSVAADRIGSLTAARMVANVPPQAVQPVLGAVLEQVVAWLGKPVRLLATGHVTEETQKKPGRVVATTTVHLDFESGAMALVTVTPTGKRTSWLEGIVVGQRGLAVLDPAGPGDFSLCEDPSGENQVPPQISPEGARLVAMVEASISQGAGISVADPQVHKIGDALYSSKGEGPGLPAVSIAPGQVADREPVLGLLLVGGAHSHQENYGADLASDDRTNLVGVTDEKTIPALRKEKLEQLGDMLSCPVLPDYDEALKRDDVHIVSVCAEPERRPKLIMKAIAAGKHVYIDKPLGGSAAEGWSVAEAAAAAGVTTQMFSQVHFPASTRVQDLLASERLGRLREIHCDMFFAKGRAGTAELARRKEDATPSLFECIEAKRELHNIGVYPLALIDMLLEKQVKWVHCTTGNFFFRENVEKNMEDYAQILLGLEDDITATINVGRTGWQSHPGFGINRVYLVGDEATAVVDADRPRVALHRDGYTWPYPKRNDEDPMGFWSSTQGAAGVVAKDSWFTPRPAVSDGEKFIDAVVNDHTAAVDAERAARVLTVLMAAYRSAALGQRVKIG